MAVEATIFAALKDYVEGRVFRDIAPPDRQTLPRITFQQIGGVAVNFLGPEAPSKRNERFQINVWAARRDDAMALAREVEDTLRATTTLAPTVLSSAVALFEPKAGPGGIDLYGSMQDFSFWT